MVSPPSISPDGKALLAVIEGVATSQQIAIYAITHPGQPIYTFQPHVLQEVDRKNPIFADPNYPPDETSFLWLLVGASIMTCAACIPTAG
jgi:hypothetical protein